MMFYSCGMRQRLNFAAVAGFAVPVVLSLALAACFGGSKGGSGSGSSAVSVDPRAEEPANVSDPEEVLKIVATFPQFLLEFSGGNMISPGTQGGSGAEIPARIAQSGATVGSLQTDTDAVIGEETVQCTNGGSMRVRVTDETVSSPFQPFIGEPLQRIDADFNDCIEAQGRLRLNGPADVACGDNDACDTVTYFQAGSGSTPFRIAIEEGDERLDLHMSGIMHFLDTTQGSILDRRTHTVLRIGGSIDSGSGGTRSFSGFVGRTGDLYRIEQLGNSSFDVNGPFGFVSEGLTACAQGAAEVQTLTPLGPFPIPGVPSTGHLLLSNASGEQADVTFIPNVFSDPPSGLGEVRVKIDGEETIRPLEDLAALATACPL